MQGYSVTRVGKTTNEGHDGGSADKLSWHRFSTAGLLLYQANRLAKIQCVGARNYGPTPAGHQVHDQECGTQGVTKG